MDQILAPFTMETRIVRESDYSPAAPLFMLLKSQVLKIQRGNEILTIKGHDSATNNQNPNLDLVNVNAYIKCSEILSISSIERKQNSDINQGL